LAAWHPGDLAAWHPGDLAAWHPGDLAAWHPGDLAERGESTGRGARWRPELPREGRIRVVE
ncbi:hypothetical protein OKJ48_24530, partial [Streptomyces kunmingensis]